MKIKLKLFAMLEERLPPGSDDNTMELEVPEGTTASQIVDRMKIPRAMATLAMVDGVHLTPAAFERQALHAGETLAIFPPIAGG